MRVIPSVTDTTVPWVRMSVDAPKPSIRLFSNSLISDGLSCMFRLLECCILALVTTPACRAYGPAGPARKYRVLGHQPSRAHHRLDQHRRLPWARVSSRISLPMLRPSRLSVATSSPKQTHI